MSILSLENSERLFWLGRYSERVYTGIKFFAEKFDEMTGNSPKTSKADFTAQYCFDESNQSSIYYSLMRAYDNAIVLRDEIGTATFSYIQLAVYEMNRAKISPAPLLELQKVTDNIAAFWGMADDVIEDEHARSIIKFGKRLERVDLYARMKADSENLRREIRRLTYRIEKTGLRYSHEKLSDLNIAAGEGVIDYSSVMRAAEGLIDFAKTSL